MTDAPVQHPTILKLGSGQTFHSFHREQMGRIVFRSTRNDVFRPIAYPLHQDSPLYAPVGRLQDVSSPKDTEAARELYPCFSPLPDDQESSGIPRFEECSVPAAFMPIKILPPPQPVKITSEGTVYFRENSPVEHPSDPKHMKPVAIPFHNGRLSIVTRDEIKYALDERLKALHRPTPTKLLVVNDLFLKPMPVVPPATMNEECALAHKKTPKPPVREPPEDDPLTVDCALAHIQRLAILSPEPADSKHKKRTRDDFSS